MIKRRSDKQSRTPGLLDYIFFTDRDLGHTFPKILVTAGLQVEKHDDHFSDNTEDIEWLQEAGRRKWIVLTHDKKMRKIPYEVRTLMEAGVREFIMIGHTTNYELASNFIATRFKVVNFLNKHHDPFMAKIYRPSSNKKSGDIKMWHEYNQWLQDKR